MEETRSRLIAQNTAFLYIRMLVVMLINIISVRFVLKGLGVVDYGIFNVVAGLVTMFASLSSIISSATLRFHSYAIGEGKEEKVSEVFSASLHIFSFLSLIVLLIGEGIGIWFINTQADIPIDRLSSANWVYQFTMFTFVLGLLTAPFSSLIFAYERMGVFSVISVSECLLKFLLAYSLLHVIGDHLITYGVGLLVIQIAVWVAYFTMAKKGCALHYYSHVDKSLYKKLLAFSGWSLFSSSAGIGISQLVTMITNVFFGPVVNAARAISFQISTALSSFTGNIILAVKPPMIKQYAEGDYEKVNMYFSFCNKAVFYSLLLLVIPLFFEMETVLKIWLDVDDIQTILFCRLVLVYALILSLNNPISIIVQATGNIRAYSTYVEIPTLLCFPLTWVLYALGQPAEVAYYVMIFSVVVSHVIRLICLKKLFCFFSVRSYLVGFLLPAIIISVIVSMSMLVIPRVMEAGIIRLLLSFAWCSVIIILCCIGGGLSQNERKKVLSIIGLGRD